MSAGNYQDAVQVLKDHIGGTWQGSEVDGRDEMVKTLKRELNYTDEQADDAIDAMIRTGQLRYNRGDQTDNDVPPVLPVPAVNTGGTAGGGSGTVGGGPVLPVGVLGGHWQIGEAGGDEPGRAGQVKVDY